MNCADEAWPARHDDITSVQYVEHGLTDTRPRQYGQNSILVTTLSHSSSTPTYIHTHAQRSHKNVALSIYSHLHTHTHTHMQSQKWHCSGVRPIHTSDIIYRQHWKCRCLADQLWLLNAYDNQNNIGNKQSIEESLASVC